jgi:hypothetical protein
MSAEDLRAVVNGMLFARCGNAREEGLATRTQINTPPQLVSNYCTSDSDWQEQPRGTRTPRSMRACYWTASPKAMRDLVKFQDMPPPAPMGSTAL